ncbi:SpoIIE family protein phosphatase [Actinomycetospora sp. OC33-EN08]|uniref:SpoIIE family protein phosphatase n=1 Tax=Actinomycetospora aurantiaca TaxID=3129233 RepID=A0ABU8MRL9_9PSEU
MRTTRSSATSPPARSSGPSSRRCSRRASRSCPPSTWLRAISSPGPNGPRAATGSTPGSSRTGASASPSGTSSGTGVGAAAVMSQLRAVLADALETTADAEAALRQLERFAATVRGAHAATVVVAVLDPVAGVLDYVTRGHPAPVLVDAAGRGRSLLGSGGGPLGGELDGPAQRTELAEGDVVMFFSDGLVERRGRPYPEGIDRLTRISEGAVQGRIWPAGTASSVVERVCVDAVDILAREGHEDDATILAVSRRPAVAPLEIHAHATPSNVAEARARVRAWLADLRVDPTDQLALEMAVGEALDNAVEHGLAHDARGTIAVSLVLTTDGRVHVSVGDDGTWREPGPAATGRGRGLVVLGSVGEGLDIAADPGGTTVRLHRRVGRPVRDPVREAPTPDPTEEPPFSAQPLPGAPDTIVVAGPVDSRSADEFRRALAHASRGSTTDSTVDLSAVTHLTSIGVAALVETREKAERAGRRCRFVAPTGTAAAFVLDLVGLSRGEPESDH